MHKSRNPIAQHYLLKKPCANCPVLRDGAIDLMPGRVASILQTLLDDDRSTFSCHKTVHHPKGGQWTEDGDYEPSGNETMCAGFAAVLMKAGRPTVGMRIAMAVGVVTPTHWDAAKPLVLEPQEILADAPGTAASDAVLMPASRRSVKTS